MGSLKPEASVDPALDQILGYLNFSSGAHDPKFFANLNLLFGSTASQNASADQPGFQAVRDLLLQRLEKMDGQNATFRDTTQSRQILDLTFNKLLPAYLTHHHDQLFHQPPQFLFNSFFLGRVFESALQTRSLEDPARLNAPEGESEFIAATISRLNDYLGHRPVATLESQKIEPYPREWIRPVPLFIRDVGAANGRYQELLEIAIRILGETNGHILRSAHFDPKRLDELAIDPRAFDFDHPINRRPNHHFGQWDEHLIDGDGSFRRFIVNQVTLDSLLERVEELSAETGSDSSDLEVDATYPRDELMTEAGAVLAGTMLMASGISGSGPGAHDSNTTLGSLLPVIAGYRDEFYLELIQRLAPAHQKRLLAESKTKHQPFGGARQSLNAALARKRASQLVNCRLAMVFARMGYQEAADRQSDIVPVASARLRCQIDCMLKTASGRINSDQPDQLKLAFDVIPAVMKLLKRGIECGAIIDPWNILGFDAHYSLFPAQENSVNDHRAHELVELIERILGLCSRVWSEAAARDDLTMCDAVKLQFKSIVDWWRQFAAHEVMSVEAVDPQELFDAAELVARALNLWHKGGAEADDINFWRGHAAMFDSPKAYALVIDALMQRDDYGTSSALLVNWLCHADRLSLQQGDSSFHDLLFRWVSEQRGIWQENPDDREKIWTRLRKFHDFLEANAEHYWDVPTFQLNREFNSKQNNQKEDDPFADPFEDEPEENDLYRAAYDDVTYHDTTDDGNEGSIFDSSDHTDEELEAEVDRVLDRLEFLGTIASYWRVVASIPLPHIQTNGTVTASKAADPQPDQKICDQLLHRRQIISSWIDQATRNEERLISLLGSVHQYALPNSGAHHDAMVSYDRHRLFKESLLDRTITTCVENENALRMMKAVIRSVDFVVNQRCVAESDRNETPELADDSDQSEIIAVYAAGILHRPDLVVEHFPAMIEYLHGQPLLYVPLSKGGDPVKIVSARVLQTAIRELLGGLPQLGLMLETHELTGTALAMERNHPIGRGAVTEFDELFRVAYSSMVHTLAQSTQRMRDNMLNSDDPNLTPESIELESENVLFDCIEMLTESMLLQWLEHSKTLRLTVLEKVNDKNNWFQLVDFIQTYGDGLFTQQFLHLANIRAILHQGVGNWLQCLEESHDPPDLRLLDEIGTGIPRDVAVAQLTLVLEAIIENYSEYRDYNTTTTQSDHGNLLYILLDFLKLRGHYERVCWNLKPVIWGHEILVRDNQEEVAHMWRRSLNERVGPKADHYLDSFHKLRKKYSIRMASIGRRLGERFGQPMEIDRLKALVGPAMEDVNSTESKEAFELLYKDTQNFAAAPMGAGVESPTWLVALAVEVEDYFLPARLKDQQRAPEIVHPLEVPIAKFREQLEQLPRREPPVEPPEKS